MIRHQTSGSILGAFVVGIVFFIYYSFTSYHLPNSAGPDFAASQAAVHFYLEQQRLAVIPQDEDKLMFTKYGNSRVTRPPLSFVVTAMLAKVSPWFEKDWRFAYRHASALFSALTLSAIFFGVVVYFGSFWLATLGVLLVGLLPQFAFTASYLNDDSAAFFAVTLLVLAMIMIVKQGVGFARLALFAFSVGLLLISKKTAWLLVPFAALFYSFYIIKKHRSFCSDHIVLLLFFIIGGGWWMIFNMYHYGWQDPFFLQTGADLSERHTRVDLQTYGFKAHGLNIKGLIFLNYKDFIGASFKAVVGHLDWLRLRVGSLQYGFYLVVALSAGFYVVWRAGYQLYLWLKQKISGSLVMATFKNDFLLFETLLCMMILFQIYMYVHHNVHNDIQIQGKYIIPVIFPLLILALSVFRLLKQSVLRYYPSGMPSKLKLSVLIGKVVIIILPVSVHIDALISHVIPFYWP